MFSGPQRHSFVYEHPAQRHTHLNNLKSLANGSDYFFSHHYEGKGPDRGQSRQGTGDMESIDGKSQAKWDGSSDAGLSRSGRSAATSTFRRYVDDRPTGTLQQTNTAASKSSLSMQPLSEDDFFLLRYGTGDNHSHLLQQDIVERLNIRNEMAERIRWIDYGIQDSIQILKSRIEKEMLTEVEEPEEVNKTAK